MKQLSLLQPMTLQCQSDQEYTYYGHLLPGLHELVLVSNPWPYATFIYVCLLHIQASMSIPLLGISDIYYKQGHKTMIYQVIVVIPA